MTLRQVILPLGPGAADVALAALTAIAGPLWSSCYAGKLRLWYAREPMLAVTSFRNPFDLQVALCALNGSQVYEAHTVVAYRDSHPYPRQPDRWAATLPYRITLVDCPAYPSRSQLVEATARLIALIGVDSVAADAIREIVRKAVDR